MSDLGVTPSGPGSCPSDGAASVSTVPASIPNAALLALAERVEKASGPDRELDARIWCAIRGLRYVSHNEAYASFGGFNPSTQVEFKEAGKRSALVSGNPRYPHALPFTASLDAAMSLVPEGHGWAMGSADTASWANVFPYADDETAFATEAATPALALTAACLRARASGIETEGHDREDGRGAQHEGPVAAGETPNA